MELDLGVPGIGVGHWSDHDSMTGCTVVVLPEGSVASGEVRGGAPATREFALLDPTRTVDHVDAVVLGGGSAFGLAAADGVVGVLEAAGRGFETKAGRVPIVVAMGIYDLAVGRADVRPGPDAGADAARAATAAIGHPVEIGRVGAGTGATLAKWRGPDHSVPGGLGGAMLRHGELVVAALVVVNAVGELDDGRAADAIRAGSWDGWPAPPDDDTTTLEATTIGLIVTNAQLDKVGCHLVAQSGHNGFARALIPAHTRADGDALVAASCGSLAAPVDVVRLLATLAVEQAVRSVAS